MRRILVIAGVAIVAIVVIVLGLAATRPDVLHVERKATLDAPPADVFTNIDDLRLVQAWSPWAERDPDMQTTFSPVTTGAGAFYEWDGNDDVGSGRQTIVESIPNEKTVTALEFREPFESSAFATMTLTPVGDDQTEVVWTLDSPNTFTSKLMGLFLDMDGMIGDDYERGLAKLGEVSAATAAAREQAEAEAHAEAEAEDEAAADDAP